MAGAETFGQLLRRYRRRADLTQKGLAARSGVALRSIVGLEGDRRARPRGDTIRLLADALGLTADERAHLEATITPVHPSVPGIEAPHRTLIRYDSDFVGRERDLAELRVAGAPEPEDAPPGGGPSPPLRPRLITLVGPGGSGKTRLALRLAEDLAGDYRDGTRLVVLSGLINPENLPRAVARAVGLPAWSGLTALDALAGALRSRQLLLLLDECELLLDPCATLVASLLRRCPALRFVATSHEPLQVEGEMVWRVAPLDLPGASGTSVGGRPARAPFPAIRASAAVRLFADRAALALPTFTVNLANAGRIEAICRVTGGLPLAIELVAARVGTLSLEALAASFAAMPSEDTLTDTIAWSYALLASEDRALLRGLAAFAGSWPGEAAPVFARAGDGAAVSTGLRRLVQAALIQPECRDGGLRYRLARPIRDYARAKGRAAGEEDEARDRHLDWCSILAEEAVRQATGGPGRAWWGRQLDDDDDDLAAALIWALDHDPARGLRLAESLRRFCLARHPGETSWERLLPLFEQRPAPIPAPQ